MIYGNITNASVVGHGERSEWQCRLGYEVISEDIATNTRQIKLQLEARSIDSRYTAVGYQLTSIIDGVPVATISMNFSTSNVNVWQVLGTRIITIAGAFNGTKKGSFTTNLTADWGLKSGSASVTINLGNLHKPPVITSIDLTEQNTLLDRYLGIAQHLSVKNITFETQTYDDAVISSYQVYHNGVLIGSNTLNGMTLNFGDVGTLATFEMNGKDYCTLKFVVIDSYGTTGSSEMQFEVTKYTKPNLIQTSSNIKRNGQLTGKVKLNLVGSFFNKSINNIANKITLKFKYWKKGEQESTIYYDIPFDTSDNNIDLYDWNVAINNKEITNIDKNYAYNFKIKAIDYFNKQSEILLLCPVGEYLWAEFKDRVDFKNITIQGVNPFAYSEEEVRVGTWFDKPRYIKVIDCGYLPNASLKEVSHGISNLDHIISLNGMANNGANYIPLPRPHTAGSLSVVMEANKTDIILYTEYDFSTYLAYIIVEYTKTTD